VYVADEPVTVEQIAAALEGSSRDELLRVLQLLQEEYRREDRGLEIREIAGGYKMFTKPEHHDAVRRFVKNLTPPLKLSIAALETLATIAYRQPVTLPEIQQIRGVNAAGVLKTLLDKKLITTAGRKKVMGSPILYRTTKEFLIQFGLSSLQELPSIEEFEELARAAVGDILGEPAPRSAPEERPDSVVEPSNAHSSDPADSPASTGGDGDGA
ncbi:MAG TPA: SMC-Scp complex subunit ScpB, partial [Burkholderiales bacterium]|nr:SMC-Scp complex subunit ScpB [Burkholderiales bacterium]